MLKSSSSHRDFKKVKAKVGRKIAKTGTQNKSIKVSSKKLQIASQLKESDGSVQSLIQRLNHYSGVARLTALQEMRNMIVKLSSPSNYVSQIVPPSIESLFDEDLDNRKAVLDLYSVLVSLCDASSFLSVMPIVVTYLCSGLTNLSRNIRATTLYFLQMICLAQPGLLTPFHSKLTEYLLAMLRDATQLGCVINHFKRDKKHDKPAKELKTKLTFLSCIVQVLVSFFRVIQAERQGGTTDCIDLVFDASSPHNGIITLRKMHHNHHLVLVNNNGTSLVTSACIPDTLVIDLLAFLTTLWSQHLLTESALPNESSEVLITLSALVTHMHIFLNPTTCAHFGTMLKVAFSFFPYSSKEADVALPNSTVQLQSSYLVQSLNISLCELVLQIDASLPSCNEYSMANQFLAHTLDAHLHRKVVENVEIREQSIVQIERCVKAVGRILLNDVSVLAIGEVMRTINAFLGIINQLVTMNDSITLTANIPLLLAVYTCTCDFVEHKLSHLSADLEQSGLITSLLSIISSYNKTLIYLPAEPGYYSERLLSAFLCIVRQYPVTLPTNVELASSIIRSTFTSEETQCALYSRASHALRLVLLNSLYFVPDLSFNEELPNALNVVASCKPMVKEEMAQLLTTLYQRYSLLRTQFCTVLYFSFHTTLLNTILLHSSLIFYPTNQIHDCSRVDVKS